MTGIRVPRVKTIGDKAYIRIPARKCSLVLWMTVTGPTVNTDQCDARIGERLLVIQYAGDDE